MITATIISKLNVREYSANALLELSENSQTLDEYILSSSLIFTDFDVEQEFISRLFYMGQRMDESLAQLESSIAGEAEINCSTKMLRLVQN